MLASFLGIAVFSFTAVACFGFDCMHQTHNWCIAAGASARPCPENTNLLTLMNFHINALKGFSTAVFGEPLGIFTMIVSFAALAGLIIFTNTAAGFLQIPVLDKTDRWRRMSGLPARKFMRWLSLHQKRDSHAHFRAYDFTN